MNHSNLGLTPQNSPFYKSPTPKSPTKSIKVDEAGLFLRKVIGTTTDSAHGFDHLSSKRCFAYLAGAAAVMASFDNDLNLSQRFFRARPCYGENDSHSQWGVSSPSPLATRHRTFGGVREGSVGASPLGQSVRDATDSPTAGKSSSAKDRVKALTSIALSPNGKWLAVGETGYKPRILVFSIADDWSESPVATISEHTFGVHALAFSHDSRYLASLGTVNDGFLHVWSVDGRSGSAVLHASNKCTVAIRAMVWLGSNIVTAGLRHVKVWRLDDMATVDSKPLDASNGMLTPRHRQERESRSCEFGNSVLSPRQKVLEGKNSLLGELLDANFISISGISSSAAILCSDSGEVCLLDDAEKKQSITLVAEVGFAITAACIDNSRRLQVKGRDGEMQGLSVDDLVKTSTAFKRSGSTTPTNVGRPNSVEVNAVAFVEDVEIAINSQRTISLTRSTGDDSELVAHGDAAIGTRPFNSTVHPNVDILSFSADGNVMLWDRDGICASKLQVLVEPLDEIYGLENQLKAVSAFADGSMIAAADRYGILSILDVESKETLNRHRAHSAEVMDVATYDASLIATAGRDRTVQLFAWREKSLELLQTMDEHAGAVTGVMFAQGGRQLLSCSPDRSVVVREAILRDEHDPYSIAFVMLRAISLKSSPTSMCLTENSNTIIVATTDRWVGRYNTKTGQLSNSFKCSDSDGGEAVIATKVLFSSSLNGSPTIIVVSSSDKSVRLYTEHGSLVARDWGHTEGITDAALISNRLTSDNSPSKRTGDSSPSLVTVAADSTMFIWNTLPSASSFDQSSSFVDQSTPTEQAMLNPPLRKVISHSELARTKREKSDPNSASPPPTSAQPSSPQRVRKKTSRMSVAQPPRLEPAFRSSFAEPSSRRQSLRHRSPSPPSPRTGTAAVKREAARRPSGFNKQRSKSSENVTITPSTSNIDSASSEASNLSASTASLVRNLRSYRRKFTLHNQRTSDTSGTNHLSSESLVELQEELKLTLRALSDNTQQRPRSQTSHSRIQSSEGNDVEEAMMAKLLDRASEKIVTMLDGRIRERVEVEMESRRVRQGEGSIKEATGVREGAEKEKGTKGTLPLID
ncbi:hypothetical protein MBLNU230_g0659t1 [Neophaeotheca triangularis]